MGAARPELVFLSGPQEGERAVLMTNVVLIGRSASADVHLREEHASREQARFALTPDGWVMENLSANGTRVNDKKYKKPKKLLLETGDVLGVGLETTILYVAPGDDPEQALRAYRQAHAAPPPVLTPVPEAETKPKPPPPAPKPPPPPQAAPAEGAKGSEEQLEIAEEAGAGGGKLKYVLFAAVIVGVVALGIALIVKSQSAPGDGDVDPLAGRLRRLTDLEIGEALAKPIERPPSHTQAAEALDRAVRLFPDRNRLPGSLYQCAKDFKLHLAFKHSKSFDRIKHERMFEQVKRELEDRVRRKYKEAWKFEMAGRWGQAKTAFDELRVMLPKNELEETDPINTVIMANVFEHLKYVKRRIYEEREKTRR